MKVLVTGASGLVGGQLFAASSEYAETYGTYLGQKKEKLIKLDITDAETVFSAIMKLRPDVIIHTAALTNVDYCETDRKMAWKVNVEGTKNIANVAKAVGAKLVYISTDYVFDGKYGPYSEDDAPSPINYYGTTKLEAEKITAAIDKWIIVRSTWIYDISSDPKNFVRRLIDILSQNREMKVPKDQIANPTLARYLASSIVELIRKDFNGTINIAGSTRLSKYDFAKKAAERFHLDASLIVPVTSEELAQPALRPKNCGFKLAKAGRIGLEPETLEESLARLPEIKLY